MNGGGGVMVVTTHAGMSTPFPVHTFWGQGFNFLGTGFIFFGDRDFPAGTGIFRGFGGSGTGYLGSEVK